MTTLPARESVEIRRPGPRPGRETLLELRTLRTSFATDEGVFHAVDKVSFSVGKGEAVALVGESGSGKSVTALSIMGLVQSPGRITGGEVLFRGQNLVTLPDRELRKIRGDDIAMIFQEPMTSLNPVFTIGDQIAEAVQIHREVRKKEARRRAVEMLELVAIPDPHKRLDDYPHQLSGGMRQRVMIAMALSCDPVLLIADEPTTALDVTIQAQIMELLARLQQQLGLAILLITHDLGVVAEFCERIMVMYTGRIVEEAPVLELFGDPKHPYTQGLLRSLPKLPDAVRGERPRLETIPGTVPSIDDLPKGCKFNTRCPEVMEICYGEEPARMMVGEDHDARCYLYGDLADPERPS
ncbi:MAG TPA: ABC transporter ATP-binding protein [Thermoanaerobaculia bacterium]|nr:ABC transporter ATP-binding protein [Thermoanaerobaculia bacterium]